MNTERKGNAIGRTGRGMPEGQKIMGKTTEQWLKALILEGGIATMITDDQPVANKKAFLN